MKFSILRFCLTVLLFSGAVVRPNSSGDKAKDLQTASGATRQRAIFVAFLASQGPMDTALSISNTLAAPPGIAEVFEERFPNLSGTLEFFLWDTHGHLIHYETEAVSPGGGLTPEGFLEPGCTYRILLSELLEAADYRRHALKAGHDPGSFSGYAWVVANFDGVQGTATVTNFSTFTQNVVMQPDLGSTFFDYDAGAGVPITSPRRFRR